MRPADTPSAADAAAAHDAPLLATITEAQRLATLESYGALDAPPDTALDMLTKLAAEICDVPMANVSLVDATRQWFASAFGHELRETPRDVAFCSHAIAQLEPLVVPDAHADPRFARNPLVTGAPFVRFYAGWQLTAPDGAQLGTLCVLDRRPRELAPHQRRALATLAHQVMIELEARRRRSSLPAAADRAVDLTQLVIHDLKNPLAVVLASAEFLAASPALRGEDRETVGDVRHAADAIHALVLDLLDVTRAPHRGLDARPIALATAPLFAAVARDVRAPAEMRGVAVTSAIAPGAETLRADPSLLRRLLRNLADNAVAYSPAAGVVRLVAAPSARGGVELCVIDGGPGVPDAQRDAIFEPFVRLPDASQPARAGHGLGLAFCRLAARAHGGDIAVEPNASGPGSCFRVRLPA